MMTHYHALLNAPVITPAEYRTLLLTPALTRQEKLCRTGEAERPLTDKLRQTTMYFIVIKWVS